ncbi:hypothetical protein Tco_0589196 [Tanacetum coccineum]
MMEDMGLLDFVNSADPFKVKVGERTIAENKVPLLTKTEDRVIAPSTKTLQLMDQTFRYCKKVRFSARWLSRSPHRSISTGKTEDTPRTLFEKLVAHIGLADIGYGYSFHPTEEFVSSFVTLTLKRKCQDESDSAQDGYVRTRTTSDRFVILNSRSEPADTGALASPKVASPIPYVQTKVEATITANETETSYVLGNDTEGSSSARMGSLQPMIFMNPKLSIPLLRVSELEFMVIVKVEELASLSGETNLKDQFVAMQDIEIQRLKKRSSDLDARLSKLSYQVDSDLYPHLLTAIVRRRWVISHGLRLVFMKYCQSLDYQAALGKVISLAIDQDIQQDLEARIEHGKARRELGVVTAYDLGVKARYKEAVGELENISLPFLDRMESYNNATLECIMEALYLEGSPGDEDQALKIRRLHSVFEHVTVLIYYEWGGLRVPDMMCREFLLGEALEASRPRAQKCRRDASSSLVIAEPVTSGLRASSLTPIVEGQETSSSLVVAVTPLISLAIFDYPISDVSMMMNVAADGELAKSVFCA